MAKLVGWLNNNKHSPPFCCFQSIFIGGSVLSMFLEYYHQTYASPSIKDYILGVVHSKMSALPWHHMNPSLKDVELFAKVKPLFFFRTKGYPPMRLDSNLFQKILLGPFGSRILPMVFFSRVIISSSCFILYLLRLSDQQHSLYFHKSRSLTLFPPTHFLLEFLPFILVIQVLPFIFREVKISLIVFRFSYTN